MPGGAFRIVWDALLAGEPTAAYVLNLAGDGSAYWAMASIVPVAEGFLSVRTRPARTDPVSYTHLDVYKRQAPGHRAGDVDDSVQAGVEAHCREGLLGLLQGLLVEPFRSDGLGTVDAPFARQIEAGSAGGITESGAADERLGAGQQQLIEEHARGLSLIHI